MKYILLLLLPIFSFSQSLKKQLSEDKKYYQLSNVVSVENGKEEDIKVNFSATIPIEVWNKYSKKKGEKEYFNRIAFLLSIQAKGVLKNPLSFDPFRKQSFSWNGSKYICYYKMSARNGIGNLTETQELVKLDPEANSIPIPSISE